MNYALNIENLCKEYQHSDFKLNDVSLAVPEGSIMGFVGKNGAGKTTTINSLLNIIKKDSGTVTIFGEQMEDTTTTIRNDIGVVFDNMNFSGELTPVKLEKIMADIYSNWNPEMYFKFLGRFKIPHTAKLKSLSRGMSMKLSIIVALSHESKLLILDEATAGLDPSAREEILDLFLEFVEDEKKSILISSHITSDLEKIADYITYIHNGEIVLTESKDTLIYNYGVVRCKPSDFESIPKEEYISFRQRGLWYEALVPDKQIFSRSYPNLTVDSAGIDEILLLITKED